MSRITKIAEIATTESEIPQIESIEESEQNAPLAQLEDIAEVFISKFIIVCIVIVFSSFFKDAPIIAYISAFVNSFWYESFSYPIYFFAYIHFIQSVYTNAII